MNHDNLNRPPTVSPHIELDLKAYAPYLENADISEDDKRQLIEALWSVVVSFVQLGFGLTPAQHVLDARSQTTCGQLPKNHDHSQIPASDRVEYSHSLIENFVCSAHADSEEGVST